MSIFYNPKETGRPVTIKDEGLSLDNNVASIDFAGAGVIGTALGNEITETIAGAVGAITGDGIAKITVGTTQPTNPEIGNLWLDQN